MLCFVQRAVKPGLKCIVTRKSRRIFLYCWFAVFVLQAIAEETLASPRRIVPVTMLTPVCVGTTDTCGWPAGASMDVAAQLAVEHVNAALVMGTGYQLQLTVVDDQCSPDVAVQEVSKILLEKPSDRPFLVIGSGCSGPTGSMSLMLHLARIPQISHAATSMKLSQRGKYPNIFRIDATDLLCIKTWFKLAHSFSWMQLALIMDSFGEGNLAIAKDILMGYGGELTVILSEFLREATDVSAVLGAVLQAKVRVLVMMAYATATRRLVCAMALRGIRGMYPVVIITCVRYLGPP